MGATAYFANNTRLAVIPAEGGTPRSITDRFDENPSFVRWNADGLGDPLPDFTKPSLPKKES